MNPDLLALIAVVQLVVLLLQAFMVPAIYRTLQFFWKLERRVYRCELELDLVQPDHQGG